MDSNGSDDSSIPEELKEKYTLSKTLGRYIHYVIQLIKQQIPVVGLITIVKLYLKLSKIMAFLRAHNSCV
jgi:hypothetical protein